MHGDIMKATPKSCNCYQCRRGKSSKAGNLAMKKDERAFRHNTKVTLNKGDELIVPAQAGNRYD